MTETITVTAILWMWKNAEAAASWHFLTIAGEAAEAIRGTALMRKLESGGKRGWDLVRVTATIGETRWQTSVFPSKDPAGYLLPVKAAVRRAEALVAGEAVTVRLDY